MHDIEHVEQMARASWPWPKSPRFRMAITLTAAFNDDGRDDELKPLLRIGITKAAIERLGGKVVQDNTLVLDARPTLLPAVLHVSYLKKNEDWRSALTIDTGWLVHGRIVEAKDATAALRTAAKLITKRLTKAASEQA